MPVPSSTINSVRNKQVRVTNGSLPMVSLLNAATLNTVGTTIDMGGARNNHSLFVVAGTGAGAGVITLLGSNDGVNFVTTATTITIAAAGTQNAVLTNTPYRYLAAKITTGVTGGTATVSIASC